MYQGRAQLQLDLQIRQLLEWHGSSCHFFSQGIAGMKSALASILMEEIESQAAEQPGSG